MSLTISADDAIRALRFVVADKGPDHVYTPPDPSHMSCVYAWPLNGGELCPVCIVGCALHYLGVPLQLMYGEGNSLSAAGLAHKLKDHGYVLHPHAVTLFRIAQQIQDTALQRNHPSNCECSHCTTPIDTTWGAALTATEKMYRALHQGK